MTNQTSNLIALYGSGPRQKLEIAHMKLRRIQSDATNDPKQVQTETAKLLLEIEVLGIEVNPTTPPSGITTEQTT